MVNDPNKMGDLAFFGQKMHPILDLINNVILTLLEY